MISAFERERRTLRDTVFALSHARVMPSLEEISLICREKSPPGDLPQIPRMMRVTCWLRPSSPMELPARERVLSRGCRIVK